MNRLLVAAVLAAGILSESSFAAEPLQPGYKVDEAVQLFFREYLVTGPGVDQPREGNYLVCTYQTRPVVMVYTRAINAAVIRLIKNLDEATGTHFQRERLGSYVVLICENQESEKGLKALSEREKIRHTLLSLVVINETRPHKRFDAKFGVEAETTVIVANSKRQVKACYAYRKDELKDKDIAQILGDLPKILPKMEIEQVLAALPKALAKQD